MDTEKKFKTKTGYCHIVNDKIILTRDGIIGNVAKVTMGNNIARSLIIYGLLSLGLLYSSFKSFENGKTPPAILFLVFGILLIINIVYSWNNSGTPVIERNRIREIKFKKMLPGARRAYFTVHFENEKGESKKRLIMLPGSLYNGEKEAEKALEIMLSEFGNINISY